jgi:peptide subunit release factor 1 (eRF1)
MLDELLGRAELKERIAELEAERDDLADQLEAEQRRRSEAARERQDAEERVNRLEDRIDQLEGDLERLREGEDDADALSFRRETTVRGDRLDAVLSRLESVTGGPESVLTAFVPDDDAVPEAVRDAFGDHAGLVARAAPCLVVTDDAGLVSVALRPPVHPEPFCEWGERAAIDREWFLPTGRFALALVRADVFAVGTYDGRDRVAFDGFETDVKSKHSKGGFSQARFERLRDEQIQAHVDRCRDALADVAADRLYVVGDRAALEHFDADATAAVDATGEPADALGEAFADFFTTRLYAI